METTQEECLEEIAEGADECDGDFNAAMRCMQSADALEDMAECVEICEADEEEEESE